MINPLVSALAIPAFLLLIWIEYKITKAKKLQFFNFNNSIVNICIGIAERLSDIFLAGVYYSIFDFIQKTYGLIELENTILMYLLLLILTDFIWYWYHRSGHEVNIFWASHIVHHQSEDFNFTTSARITMFQSFIRLFFWSALPLIGFPAPMVSTVLLLHGVYPFFVHTRTIKKLGILEKFLVTPSHHRVHHASNEEYLDKNYGSIFILWDKLFGTFKEEKTEPVYGLTVQLKSHSFLWQHFHTYLELWVAAKSKQTFFEKIKFFFAKPESIPYEIRENLENIFLTKKYHKTPSLRPVVKKYLLSQVLISIFLLTTLALIDSQLSTFNKIMASLFIVLTSINCCAILEQRTWIFYLEYIRIAIIMLSLAVHYQNPVIVILYVPIIFSMLLFFSDLKLGFLKVMYGPAYKRLFIARN